MFARLIASGEDLVNPFGNCGYGNKPAGSCYTGGAPLNPSFCVNGLHPYSGDCIMGANGNREF